MTVSAQEACYTVFNTRLRNGSALWGVRVQSVEIAGSTLVKPYVVFFAAANIASRSNPHHKQAVLTISVKGVAEDTQSVAGMATAVAMQEAITQLLDDSGTQDLTPRLPYNADWVVTNVTEDRTIWLQEYSSVGTMIYHAGHQYQVMMERR